LHKFAFLMFAKHTLFLVDSINAVRFPCVAMARVRLLFAGEMSSRQSGLRWPQLSSSSHRVVVVSSRRRRFWQMQANLGSKGRRYYTCSRVDSDCDQNTATL
jgi:hypothetical protein